LIEGEKEEVLLTTLLKICSERGWLKERGKQRTDSTHIEGAIRITNRLVCTGEALRAALNSLASVVPHWLSARVGSEWYERYERRIEDFRLPKEAKKREEWAEQIGQDGLQLLQWVKQAEQAGWLREIPAVEILRQIWIQQFWVEEGKIRFRSNQDIPPASVLISSPYDPEARMSVKRDTAWTGYKVHISETCDDETPHLITHVETTSSTTQDMEMTTVIHEQLERKQLLPSEHFMDTGYVDGEHLVTSQEQYGVELIGPVTQNASWQTKDAQGYDNSQFTVDWENRTVTCPQGKTSKKWTIRQNEKFPGAVRAQFAKKDCLACPVRAQCTRAAVNPRQITLRSQSQHQAIQRARQRQTTAQFKERYAKRSGVEGTISQAVRAFDLRRSRYLGTDKTHLQHLLAATALNVVRLFQWHLDPTPFQPRVSRFAALAP
jgi:transposase